MALGPYREEIQFDLFFRRQRDGTPELLAYFKTPINGWCPCINVWRDKNEPSESPEDTITVFGENIAFCITDQASSDYDDLEPVSPKLIDAPLLFAIASLTRRVC